MSVEDQPKPFEEIAAGYWQKVEPKLPTHLTEQQKIWLKNYLQAQVAYSLKDTNAAYKILGRLDGEEGFGLFEERRPEYFAAMEMVARKKTNRVNVKPYFTREDLGL